MTTATAPRKPSARDRLIDAARHEIRSKGYAATTVDGLCAAAGVTKGAFFHHFATKDDLAVAAVRHWIEFTSALFEQAPYHAPEDPLDRVLAYLAFRQALIGGETAEFTCLAGTLVQEAYASHPPLREACNDSISGHAATLVADIAAAKALYAPQASWSPESLALHTQAVIQGAFIIAKARGDAAAARESIDHLDRYFRLLMPR